MFATLNNGGGGGGGGGGVNSLLKKKRVFSFEAKVSFLDRSNFKWEKGSRKSRKRLPPVKLEGSLKVPPPTLQKLYKISICFFFLCFICLLFLFVMIWVLIICRSVYCLHRKK